MIFPLFGLNESGFGSSCLSWSSIQNDTGFFMLDPRWARYPGQQESVLSDAPNIAYASGPFKEEILGRGLNLGDDTFDRF